jgi:hypothetical protein
MEMRTSTCPYLVGGLIPSSFLPADRKGKAVVIRMHIKKVENVILAFFITEL